MSTDHFPIIVKRAGVSAKIRQVTKAKDGAQYVNYIVEYMLLGKRKLVWRADLADAKAVALEACSKIASGEQRVLELKNDEPSCFGERFEY